MKRAAVVVALAMSAGCALVGGLDGDYTLLGGGAAAGSGPQGGSSSSQGGDDQGGSTSTGAQGGASTSTGGQGGASTSSSGGAGGQGGGSGGGGGSIGGVWSRVLGDAADQRTTAVDVDDGDGAVYVAGGYFGNMTAGGEVLTASTAEDAFVAKYDASGAPLWGRRIGGSGSDVAVDLVVDGNGDLIVVASCQGATFQSDVPATTLTINGAGLADVCVAKYSGATGALLWARIYGGVLEDIPGAVAVTGASVWVTGSFERQQNGAKLSFTGNPLGNAGGFDVFVGLLDASTGNGAAQASYGGTANDRSNGLAIDGMQRLVLVGSFDGGIDFTAGMGSALVGTAGQRDIFVARLTSALAHSWSASFGGSAEDAGRAVAIGVGNSIVVAGEVEGTGIDVGGGSINASGVDGYVAAYDSAGVHQWSRLLTGSGTERLTAIDTDSSGNLAVAGSFDSASVALGSMSANNTGTQRQIAHARLSAAGQPTAMAAFGDTAHDDPGGVALRSNNGDRVVGGSFAGMEDFGDGLKTSAGGLDAFVVSLGSN